jgi:hypothetical protein
VTDPADERLRATAERIDAIDRIVMGDRAMHYVLGPDHEVIPCGFMAWARYFERASVSGERVVARTPVLLTRPNARRHSVAKRRIQCDVSTVFLGIDHRFTGEGPPLVFETMTFGAPRWDLDVQLRWATWAEAEAGHAAVVRSLQTSRRLRE